MVKTKENQPFDQPKTGSENKITILRAQFDLDLRFEDLAKFRGAIVKVIGKDMDLLHNHYPGQKNYRYRYPLIQYRVQERKATIIGVDAGADLLIRSFLKFDTIKIGQRLAPLSLIHLDQQQNKLIELKEFQYYRLHHWLPLNTDNYAKWLELDNLMERVQLLEQILAAHLISFAKGIGWQIEGTIEVSLVDLIQHRVVKVHGNSLMAFDIVYKTNLQLPDQIGIGKAVSHGFGWQIGYRKK